MNNVRLGKQGEAEAVRLLRKSGYRIVGCNLRAKFGEIDVVARDGPVLCFIEIKARRSVTFGWPEEGVTSQKRQRLIRLANWYVQKHRVTGTPVRFDVVSILWNPDGSPARSRLIKGAFDAT